MEVLADTPDNTRIHLQNIPLIGFHTYTLQSWSNLTYPSKNITVFVDRSKMKKIDYFKDLKFETETEKGKDIFMRILYEN